MRTHDGGVALAATSPRKGTLPAIRYIRGSARNYDRDGPETKRDSGSGKAVNTGARTGKWGGRGRRADGM